MGLAAEAQCRKAEQGRLKDYADDDGGGKAYRQIGEAYQASLNEFKAGLMKQGLSEEQASALRRQAVRNGSISSVEGAAQAAVERKRVMEDARAERKEEILEPPRQVEPADGSYDQLDALHAGRTIPHQESGWEKTLDWVDHHQTGTSIGVGALVGAVAIGVTLVVVGAVTLPVLAVAAGIAAVAAGVTVAAGTMGLNAHYDRPPTTNIWSNVKAAAITAAAVTGVGLFVAGGLLTQAAIATGNAIAGTCAANRAVCANAGVILDAADKLEEAALTVQLTVETATGNPHAGETAIELQLEQMDGGAPGNTVFADIEQLIQTRGDEIAALTQKYGDDTIRYLDNVADIDLANLSLEQGFVVSELAKKFDIPITITGRWADTPAEAALRLKAVERMDELVSQGMEITDAQHLVANEFGIAPYQVKRSGISSTTDLDVFTPQGLWDGVTHKDEIREQLRDLFDVDKVDFYQEIPLDKVPSGWPNPRTTLPPGSIIFYPDGTIEHVPFATGE